MVNLKNLLVELEFKTPEDFAAYKKKHKMRPGTVEYTDSFIFSIKFAIERVNSLKVKKPKQVV